jgi:hypothetical protein
MTSVTLGVRCELAMLAEQSGQLGAQHGAVSDINADPKSRPPNFGQRESLLLITFNKSLLHAANFERFKTAHSLPRSLLWGWGRCAIAGGPSILSVFWKTNSDSTFGSHLRDCLVSRGRKRGLNTCEGGRMSFFRKVT